MAKLKPYEEYREVALPWLEKVPSHWEIKSTRYLWIERKETNHIHEQLLSVTINRGIVLQSELLSTTAKKDSSNLDKTKYKLVLQNDIVYNKMRMWQGAVGISKYRGIVSPAYIVLKPIKKTNHNYYHYLLRTPNYIGESYRFSYGICDDQLSLRYEDFKGMSIIVPPKEEQDQIAKFLDNRLSKINRFIKAKKKQIELLKEQKQAIINQAVTKGIDPKTPMKDSAVEWIGEIPEHWEIFRLKNLATINPSISRLMKTYQQDDYVVFLPMEKISENGIIDNSEYRKISDVRSGFTGFAKNDVIIAKITPCFENGKGACLDRLGTEIGFGTTELIVLRSNNKILPQYLYHITRSSYFRIIGERMMTGSAGQKRISADFVSNYTIGISDKHEQEKILEYIKLKSDAIERTIKMINKQLDLIKEYRTSLISEVVTGKVDVRDVVVEDTEEFLEDLEEV